MTTIEPPHYGGGMLIGKTGIGLLTGIMIAFLIFIVISVLGTKFFQDGAGIFMAMIFMLIACIVTIIGTGVVSGLLSLAFGTHYYDFGKMFGSSVLANGLLLILFAPIYLVLSSDLNLLLLVLAFHIIFGFFISYSLIEFTTNPNYAGSHLIGTLIGFAVTSMLYLIIYKQTISSEASNMIYYLLLLPFIVGYTLIPLFHGIWSSIYYAIFSSGANPFFIPSLNEVPETQEVDSINIEIK